MDRIPDVDQGTCGVGEILIVCVQLVEISAYQQGMLGAKGIDVSGDVDIGGIGCLAVGIQAIATVIDGDGGGSRIDAAIPIYLR